MAEIVRGTTPTFRLTIPGADLSAARNVYVSIVQGGESFEMTGQELEITGTNHNVVECYLSQANSLKLVEGIDGEIQVNWTYLDVDGETIRRAGTKAKTFHVDKQLLKRVIS